MLRASVTTCIILSLSGCINAPVRPVSGDSGRDAPVDIGTDTMDARDAAEVQPEVDNGPDKYEDPGTMTDDGRDTTLDLEASLDITIDVPPLPGEFGYSCTDNAQCISSFCVESPNGRVCSKTCNDSCPTDWVCKIVTVTGDVSAICMPMSLNLCEPCTITKDCNGELTGGLAICINNGADGSFCGSDCGTTGACPSGFTCSDQNDGAGGMSRQCIPVENGQCQCSRRAISMSLQTECFQVGDGGAMCKGLRKCLVGGLTVCDARKPRPEECNNIDDDCNGLTDELQGKFPCSRTNLVGTCTGAGDCQNGMVINCDARTPEIESCNGMDDNCDGNTDEGLCYDGKDCTSDKCDPGSNVCVFTPIAGPCDDLNPCTVNDHCDGNGQCVAGAQKNCDDLNPCTDDGCDPGTGKCIHRANTAPCDDADSCTVNDSCLSTICRGGPLKSCPEDGNPCTNNERCDSRTGACIWDTNDGVQCDDGNGCTINDTCSGGRCVGPGDWCDTQTITCVPVPPQSACIAPKCLVIPIVGPQCSCVCI